MLACAPPAITADGRQFWKEGKLQLTSGEVLDSALAWKIAYDLDAGNAVGLEFKPGVSHSVRPWLDVAVTYELARARDPGGDWQTSHAFELDLVPSWSVGERGARAEFTQRLAAAHLFDRTAMVYRYLAIPRISRPAGWLRSQQAIDVELEATFDFDISAWVESKFTPLRLTFESAGGTGWHVAYLLNSKRDGPQRPWDHAHVIVVGLRLAPRKPR